MKQYLSIATSVLLGCGVVSASDFFYGGEYDGSILTFGIRAGFNTSNMADDDMGKLFNLDSWGTGFTGGVVAELHMRDWLVIQPGFFFESRSNNYSYVYDPKMFPNPAADLVELGHTRRTLFKLPVMCSIRMHPADCLTWSVDLGPVFNFGIAGHRWYSNPMKEPVVEQQINYYDEFNRFMMGLKMGTGFQLFDHYYIGVHYEAGLRSARKYKAGGHDKAWTFTLGYDF